MKKVFYSIAVISAMTFASCGEDRGTTTEVADSNQDENVNPTQIRGYGDERTTVADMGTEAEWRQSAEQAASQMATDLQLSPEAQERVQQALFERQQRLAELEDRYNYSETSRMGGQANNDTENDMNENQATDMDAKRSNNQGNAYEGNSNVNDANNNNLQMSETDMNSERELIKADTDRELKAILTPEQFRMYEQNRANYDEIKFKNDATDTKLKVEEGEMKYKSGETKIKSEEDEMKIKTEDTKIKVEKKDN